MPERIGMRTNQADVIVIGAGASGCMAAIQAAACGAQVILLERNDRIGRKLYATGNGRCNLTNYTFGEEYYHTGDRAALSPYFDRFSVYDLCGFFEERGIFLHDRNGYVYPRTDQAATIVLALEKELGKHGVRTITGADVGKVTVEESRNRGKEFHIKMRNSSLHYSAEAVIVSAGGMAGPQYGCSGDSYRIAGDFAHSVAEPLPALTSLHTKDPSVRLAAGARTDAMVTLLEEGRPLCASRGEVQITADSISGIPAFQISGEAARVLAQHRKITVQIDFLPEVSGEAWERAVNARVEQDMQQTLGSLFLGTVNSKVLSMILAREGLQAENKAYKLPEKRLREVLSLMRCFEIEIDGTGDFAKAQTTSGGVPLSELDENLQSCLCGGLYFTGEAADVDGLCGGYNLQWAMTSGYLAGDHAGSRHKKRELSEGRMRETAI